MTVNKKNILNSIGIILVVVSLFFATSRIFAGEKKPKIIYVASSISGIYHLPDCKFAANIPSGLKLDLFNDEEVKKGQYKPCSSCKPDEWAEKKTSVFKATATAEKSVPKAGSAPLEKK